MRTTCALILVSLFWVLPGYALAQDETALADAERAAADATASRRCATEASALRVLVTAARVETRPIVRQAIVAYLSTARATLDACVPPQRHGHMRILSSDDEQSGAGTFNFAILVRLLTLHQADLLSCYEDALQSEPLLSGRIHLQITVREHGGLFSAVTVDENTTGAAGVAACVVRTVRAIGSVSPGPVGGSVTYGVPLVFEPAP